MNSYGNKAPLSLEGLINRRVFPLLALTVVLLAFLPNSIMFFILKGMIPAERIEEAHLMVFFLQYIPAATALLAILAILYAGHVIDREVVRSLARLSHWAGERCSSGEGRMLRTLSRITEIRELARVFARLFEEQARRVSELKALVGATRHNVRNHITNIASHAQFVREGIRDPVASAEKTLRETEAVVHILDLNAAISRNYSRILGDPPEEIVLADLVYDILDQFDAEAEGKGVTIEAAIPPGSLVFVSHRRNVESVIHNLIGNAIKYTPAGGKVTLSVKIEGGGLVIEVTDTGIGIPDEDKPHVFEREFRSKAVRGIAGEGLGLAFVDSVVSLYGGSADVCDNRPNGTVITVRLPAAPARPQQEHTSPRARQDLPRLITWLLKTESGWLYVLLTTMPLCGLFASVLLYVYLRNGSALALATLTLSGYVILGSFLVIGTKIARLVVLRKKRFAKSRFAIVVKVILANIALLGCYFAWLAARK